MKNSIFEKNDYAELTIDDYGLDGDGIAHVSDVTVFVKNALKGERVRAKIIGIKPKICYGVTDKIIEPSPFRVLPPCPYYFKCGGCSMQHIQYEEQLRIKRALLETTLKKQGINFENIEDTVPSNKQYNYRNKLSLPVRRVYTRNEESDKKNYEVAIGFFAKNSHRIVNIDDCLLQNFDVKKLIKIFRDFFDEQEIIPYDEQSADGEVRHLTARHFFNSTVISIVTNKPLKARLKPLNEVLKKEYGNSYALYSNLNTKNNNVIYGEKFELAGGTVQKTNVFNSVSIDVLPSAFFQVNDHIKELIYKQIELEISNGQIDKKPNEILIDAYSGTGQLGLRLAGKVRAVYCIEINEQAFSVAKALKEENSIDNMLCINGDCSVELKRLVESIDKNSSVTVVLDPPKRGVDKKVIDSLRQAECKKIIYVSCNPSTLARDLRELMDCYKISRIIPFDMFPQTGSLETLTILHKKS